VQTLSSTFATVFTKQAGMKARLILVIIFLLICLLVVGTLFWKNELRYARPTPIPKGYQPVTLNQRVTLPAHLKLPDSTAFYFHFYNPDCPCSRFNANHIRGLIQRYGGHINAYIVVFDQSQVAQAKKEFGKSLPILIDNQEALAKACGVYATPQAAIVDEHGRLYYRGNYNRARFCTATATNFAELALVSLINHQPSPQFSILATQARGCELPNTTSYDLDIF
jgi:hypothetical protein